MTRSALVLPVLLAGCWPFIGQPYDEYVADLDGDTNVDTDRDTDPDTAGDAELQLVVLLRRTDYQGGYWTDGRPRALALGVWNDQYDDQFNYLDMIVGGRTGCVTDADFGDWLDLGQLPAGNVPGALVLRPGVTRVSIPWSGPDTAWFANPDPSPFLPQANIDLIAANVSGLALEAEGVGTMPPDFRYNADLDYDQESPPRGDLSDMGASWSNAGDVDWVVMSATLFDDDGAVLSVDCVVEPTTNGLAIPTGAFSGLDGTSISIAIGTVRETRTVIGDGVEALIVTQQSDIGAFFLQ